MENNPSGKEFYDKYDEYLRVRKGEVPAALFIGQRTLIECMLNTHHMQLRAESYSFAGVPVYKVDKAEYFQFRSEDELNKGYYFDPPYVNDFMPLQPGQMIPQHKRHPLPPLELNAYRS